MAIDTTREKVLILTEAAKLVPRRGGKVCHLSTMYRWTTTGCRGIILETVQIGGSRCTSAEALQRFFQRLTDAAGLAQEEAAPSPKERRRAVERADEALAQAGW